MASACPLIAASSTISSPSSDHRGRHLYQISTGWMHSANSVKNPSTKCPGRPCFSRLRTASYSKKSAGLATSGISPSAIIPISAELAPNRERSPATNTEVSITIFMDLAKLQSYPRSSSANNSLSTTRIGVPGTVNSPFSGGCRPKRSAVQAVRCSGSKIQIFSTPKAR